LGNNQKFACSYKNIVTVKVGSPVLIADGSLVCRIKEIKETSVIVTVSNDAVIGERKNMNLPGTIIELPTVTEKDIDDI